MKNSTWLDAQELVELTDRTRCDAQVRVLRFMGVEHRVRPDKSVAVLRSHVVQLFGDTTMRRAEKEVEPDWSAI